MTDALSDLLHRFSRNTTYFNLVPSPPPRVIGVFVPWRRKGALCSEILQDIKLVEERLGGPRLQISGCGKFSSS